MRLSSFASLKLSIAIMSSIAICVLLGAWCPQESQVGYQKVVETFGAQTAEKLRQVGLTDIFHTPFFLFLIALLTFNMIVVSFQRVFPKASKFRQKMPFLKETEISKFPSACELSLNCQAKDSLAELSTRLKKKGYAVSVKDNTLTAEFGKLSRLAATITHIGLLSLLTGVTITSWTGFTGFKPVPLGGNLSFTDSEHSKQWVGKLPSWKVHVDDTRRENYESGDAKQWYSKLSVIDSQGKAIKQQEISVNNPLSYDGVDIYQSSWGLDSILVSFNGKLGKLPLQQMGETHAAFMPLDQKTILIFSLRSQDKPIKIFAKIPEWKAPRMLASVPKGYAAEFGGIRIGYVRALPITGLQYKCDPGLPVTYTAFGIIMLGVLLAAIPHRQLWAAASDINESSSSLCLGGISQKAKSAFAKSLDTLATQLAEKFQGTRIQKTKVEGDFTEDTLLSSGSQR